MEDVELSLLQSQAEYDLIQNIYALREPDVLDLAATSVYIKYGAFNAAKHKHGFLTNTIGNFVPKRLLKYVNDLEFGKNWKF